MGKREYDLSKLVSEQFPLKEADKVFYMAQEGKGAMRVILKVND